MDSIAVVVLEILFEDPAQMTFTEYDDSVQTFPSDTAAQSLGALN
jgi:hypothetical protein